MSLKDYSGEDGFLGQLRNDLCDVALSLAEAHRKSDSAILLKAANIMRSIIMENYLEERNG